eukprot:TRINITY_DN1643_c0_g6_i1.p1 TRINITY_DN1643_c0_g6~~TRINITY_DN1643_c0_g6_i1.p1  ORF type:complete len:345 (+),score=105.88 TRINITY_DN1643_c0_g6_i1:47-1036(+)
MAAEPDTSAAAGQGGSSNVLGWRCLLTGRTQEGLGRNAHTRYQARGEGGAEGRPPQDIEFRFSDVVRLRTRLEQHADLQGVQLPALPPKVTVRSVLKGNKDSTFLDERQALLQEFLDKLCEALARHYADIGDFVELCEPVGDFVRSAAEGCIAAEVAAAAAAADAAYAVESRQIIADQNAEYEESLRADELRAIAESERQEAERLAAQQREEERKQAEESAKAREEDCARRLAAFEVAWPKPQAGARAAAVRIRSASGAVLTRSFPAEMPVSALFEYAAVASWEGAPAGGFDLKTSLPVRSLRDFEDKTLAEADLLPSAALVLAEDESP